MKILEKDHATVQAKIFLYDSNAEMLLWDLILTENDESSKIKLETP